MSDEDELAIGTRVRVLDTDLNDLGLGTYRGEIAFDESGNEVPFTVHMHELDAHQKILLDTGNVIYGFQCFWSETDDEIEKAIAEIKKVGVQIH